MEANNLKQKATSMLPEENRTEEAERENFVWDKLTGCYNIQAYRKKSTEKKRTRNTGCNRLGN